MKKHILYIRVFLAVIFILALSGCASATKHTHSYGDWYTLREPTCIEEGLKERICAECNNAEQREVETLAHSYSSRTIVPGCEEQGYTIHTCACGYSYSSDFVMQTGHDFTYKTVAPDCTNSGHTKYECKNCDFSMESDFTAPTGHKFGGLLIAPTCTEAGYTHYSCINCDFEFDSDFTAPKGHTYTKQTKRATATVGGYTKYECECGYSYIGDRVYYSDILESAYVQNTEVIAKGIDVSKWNHSVNADGSYKPLDWEAIKASGVEFVIIKLGSTKSGIEPTFEMDYEGAKAAGLGVGAYFYTYSTTLDGALEDAYVTLEALKGKSFEYPIYFDMEEESAKTLGKNHLTDMCFAYIETLQNEGYYAALYTNNEWLNFVLDMPRIVSVLDIWYARYPNLNNGEYAWDEDKYGRQLGMWQYTDSGTVQGIDTVFDFNYVYKDYPALMRTWGLNGF